MPRSKKSQAASLAGRGQMRCTVQQVNKKNVLVHRAMEKSRSLQCLMLHV